MICRVLRMKMTKSKTIKKSETQKPQKAKAVLDEFDPFADFKEWANDADEKAYKDL